MANELRMRRFIEYLREYCTNCSIVGFAYIANRRLHISERIFWMICVVGCGWGLYEMIIGYQSDYRTRAVSVNYESVSPFQPIQFPSISVCPLSFSSDAQLAKYFVWFADKEFKNASEEAYNHVTRMVEFLLFPIRHAADIMEKVCEVLDNCENCLMCPQNNYRRITSTLAYNCTDLFDECSLFGKVFDCCHHFLPMVTPNGYCFLLNSLQNNDPNSGHWLHSTLYRDEKAEMKLNLKKRVRVDILDKVGLPLPGWEYVSFKAHTGRETNFKFNKEETVNDPDIRDIKPKARDCFFPDEATTLTLFKAYGFNACISECFARYQMKLCNCSYYQYNPFLNADFPDCDYNGYVCIEKNRFVIDDMNTILNNKLIECECPPSCIESDIKRAYIFTKQVQKSPFANISISFTMWPTHRFRRIALRTPLDAVVSIGGLLGLFIGASLLSILEAFYYFSIRAINIMYLRYRNTA